VRLLPVLAAVAVLAAPACGTRERSPESVVRAWSSALNSGDNESAADLFAPHARIVQAGDERRFRTRADAVEWNAGLPCSGRIVRLETAGDDVTATFLLGDRTTSRCNGPGASARAIIRVHAGKIVLFHQVPVTEMPPLETTPVV
jgi:SnoaL-like domain